MSRDSDQQFREQRDPQGRAEHGTNRRRDGQEPYRRPSEAQAAPQDGAEGTHKPRRLDDAMRSARATGSEQGAFGTAEQRFSPEIHRHSQGPPVSRDRSAPARRSHSDPEGRLDDKLSTRTQRSPAQNQWALQEENERRRREALRRRQDSSRSPDQRLSRPSPQPPHQEPYVQPHSDDRYEAYKREAEPVRPVRKKRGCLGHLLWFLLFIGLGYASIWFLIHGVSRWI